LNFDVLHSFGIIVFPVVIVGGLDSIFGAIVAGIIRQDTIIIPSGDSVIRPGDRIIIFARREAIPKVEKILSVKLEYF
jgi:Trk K+ transport system NAD-binding subunit